MLDRGKRARLSSSLLASKAEALPAIGEPATQPDAPAIAAAGDVLFSKGTASASGFRPAYWSYEREGTSAIDKEGAPSGGATVTPFPASAVAISASTMAEDRAESAGSRPALSRGSIAIMAVGCLALALSAILYVKATQGPAPASPATVAADVAPPSLPVASAPRTAASEPPSASPLVPTSREPLLISAAPPPSEPIASAPPPPTPSPTSTPAAPDPTAPVAADEGAETMTSGSASADEIADLVARGDQLLANGDVAAARAFYNQAAEQGNARAATAMGKTFDPFFLDEIHARGIRGDGKKAAEWYRRAINGGDATAAPRLQQLVAKRLG